jgi:hypothetical protein
MDVQPFNALYLNVIGRNADYVLPPDPAILLSTPGVVETMIAKECGKFTLSALAFFTSVNRHG